jgi:transcriptional regulator with XRE-family HTH domain
MICGADSWHLWPMSEKKRPLKRTFIREWREYKGLTQVQLANRLEGVVGQSTLSRLERGDYAYTQPTLEAIAEALGCEPADLIGRLPGAPHELTLLVNKLSPEARKKAIDIIKVMVAA